MIFSDSVKRHFRGRHLSVLNLKFDFISDGGCTREEQIALSLKRHLFPHGGREPKAFWICFSRVHPPSEIKSNFKFKTLKRHLLKRHLTLSDFPTRCTRCGHHFPGNYIHLSSQGRVHSIVNMGGVVKTLRHGNSLARSVFSTAGSFELLRNPPPKKARVGGPGLRLVASMQSHSCSVASCSNKS